MRICPVCKKDIGDKPKENVYCSKTCYYKMKKIRGDKVNWTDEMRKSMSEKYKGKGNPAYGKESYWKGKKRPELQGSNHPKWKGGYIQNGYKMLSVGGKNVFEHRYLMEKYLGRELTKEEVVHHINGNKLDNSIINLEVMNRSEHIEIHRDSLEKGRCYNELFGY